MINILIQNGANLEVNGFIFHSKKKKISVSSNFVGCAAYHGKFQHIHKFIKHE
jgi:hypothetical protein